MAFPLSIAACAACLIAARLLSPYVRRCANDPSTFAGICQAGNETKLKGLVVTGLLGEDSAALADASRGGIC
jgi:hypothetical protein